MFYFDSKMYVGLGWCLTGIEGVVGIKDSVVASVGVLRTAKRSYSV